MVSWRVTSNRDGRTEFLRVSSSARYMTLANLRISKSTPLAMTVTIR